MKTLARILFALLVVALFAEEWISAGVLLFLCVLAICGATQPHRR